MDIKEKPRKRLSDYIEPVPESEKITDPEIKTAVALAHELAPAPKDTDENTVWPDGQRRPYMVKVKGGANVWLTQEEYDRLTTAAQHRARRNPQGERRQPKSPLVAGDVVFMYALDLAGSGYWRCSVDRVKVDGRIRVAFDGLGHEDLPPAGSQLVVFKDPQDLGAQIPPDDKWSFVVTSSWKRGANLRLATPADLGSMPLIEE